jgi:hypothetical protein
MQYSAPTDGFRLAYERSGSGDPVVPGAALAQTKPHHAISPAFREARIADNHSGDTLAWDVRDRTPNNNPGKLLRFRLRRLARADVGRITNRSD